MDKETQLRELKDYVRRAQRVIREYLPPDSGKSKEWLIHEQPGVLDDRQLVRLQQQIEPKPALFGSKQWPIS